MRRISLPVHISEGQGQLPAAIKSLQQPLCQETYVNSHIPLSPRLTGFLWGGAWQFRNSNASDPMANLLSGCHIRSKTVGDYLSRRLFSFFSCQQVLLNRFTLSGVMRSTVSDREICFGLRGMKPHLHMFHTVPKISFSTLKQVAEAKSVLLGQKEQKTPNYYRKKKRLCQLYFQRRWKP